MNYKLKLTIVGMALCMAACSDMSVDPSDQAIKTSNPVMNVRSEVMFAAPEDFDLETYLTINPDVKYNQIIRAVRTLNKPRLDSMKITSDSVTTAEGETITVGKFATAAYNADIEEFLSDSAFAHRVFLMAGYGDDLWQAVDSLNSEQKKMMARFNVQQAGAPSVAADKKFIDEFQYDEELLAPHYVTFGILEGRPYRYCAAKEMGVLKSEAPLDTIGKRPFIVDYSANLFCLNKDDGLVYTIK